MFKMLYICTYTVGEVLWLSGRVVKGPGLDTYLRCVVSLSKAQYWLMTRKRWLHPDMTEKLLTEMLTQYKTNLDFCCDQKAKYTFLIKPF